ncbi:hypothetical protein J2847_002988 [Azospirillum agricola]|uniref:hypothetical protein n=1 Tax=Azospirillum agricola TaxID=1720247 RepID=UPI001AE4892F|nr:hypothetical protein [Azospirillum agricola]MBP2229689.1 hypothetical protein [Azospirillum agricola]
MDDRIDSRRIVMRTIGATVADVQTWSETSIHSSGGGGYVDARYGGWVAPARVWSSTETIVRARLRFGDGSTSSLDFPGRVRLSTGDDLLLVVAEEEVGRRWEYCGVANTTTGEVSYLGRFEQVCPMIPNTRLEKFGRYGIWLLLVWVLVCLEIIGFNNSVAATGTLFYMAILGGVGILVAIGQGQKAFSRRRAEAEQQYQSLFQRTCSTALTACQSATREGRQAAPVVA